MQTILIITVIIAAVIVLPVAAWIAGNVWSCQAFRENIAAGQIASYYVGEDRRHVTVHEVIDKETIRIIDPVDIIVLDVHITDLYNY